MDFDIRAKLAVYRRWSCMIHFMQRMDTLIFLCLLWLAWAPGWANAAEPTPAAQADGWQTCLVELRGKALAADLDAHTVEDVLNRVEKLPRVISADRSQPEFTQTFTDYYKKRVNDFRVETGRELLVTHQALLRRIQNNSGIPPHYLVALWGLETNFGSYFGKLSIPSALTTLACDTRRSAMFTRELLALMRIIENGDMAYEDLIGSWAGAIGHMQFMPSTFLSYAVDADGDGRKNLIGSVDDALLSGATYLANAGWQPGFRWGREVMLPDNFNYALAGLDQQRALSDWRAMGVNDSFGRPIAAISLEASLLVPSGHTGPAFLVYPNFHVIMEWNRSQYYALSVGRLADRIAGAGRLHQPLPEIALSTQALTQLQSGLNELGYAAGKPDGVLGPSTRKAIRAFQQANGLLADGFPNDMLMQSVSLQRQSRGKNQ